MAALSEDMDTAVDIGRAQPRLRLGTLTRLRWFLVVGQVAGLLIGSVLLHMALPLATGIGLALLSAALNLALKARFPKSLRLTERQALPLLAFDIVQLAVLLYFTGGLTNPFAMLFIAPVVVSATALSVRATLGLGSLAALLTMLIGVSYRPIAWTSGETLVLPTNYLVANWIGLMLATSFASAYCLRIADEARRLQAALTATELVLMRQRHLTQLDGLAAAAAHELGTPLGTIAVVSKELLREFPQGSPHAEDVELLRSQAERCREILRKLTSLNTDLEEHFDHLPISHLIEDMTAPHRDFGVALVIQLEGDRADEPVGTRNPAILYGLGNILENAMDFARSRVDVAAIWTSERVTIVIRDDGPGFAPEVLSRIGEPYLTHRSRAGGTQGKGGGLGLGFFIAKTLLERTGARLDISNRAHPEHGAIVRVEWPRAAMDIGGN